MPAKIYCAFPNGARVGFFYEIWKDVQHLNKVSMPIYKSFNNFEDAQKFMDENRVIVDELSSATGLGLHREHAHSGEHQRITTNQVQDIREKVHQPKKSCEVPSAKEILGPENDHPNTPYDNGSEEDHRLPFQRHYIATKARKERMTSQEFNLKQSWKNQKCHHCQELKNQRIQKTHRFQKCRKVVSGTNLVKRKT